MPRDLRRDNKFFDILSKKGGQIKKDYIDKDMTSEEVADKYKIPASKKEQFKKALDNYAGPKGYGHGGARKGSGNKKGTIFCSVCRRKNCKQH